MAPPSIAGAVLGGYLAGAVPSRALLLAIAAVLLYSGIDLLRWQPPSPSDGDAPPPEVDIPAAVATGGVIGLLGGFVGLILGSLRMPALLRIVHETPARAVGTNVTVGFCVGVAGALAHLPDASPDWGLLALGGAASIPGALLGSRAHRPALAAHARARDRRDPAGSGRRHRGGGAGVASTACPIPRPSSATPSSRRRRPTSSSG